MISMTLYQNIQYYNRVGGISLETDFRDETEENGFQIFLASVTSSNVFILDITTISGEIRKSSGHFMKVLCHKLVILAAGCKFRQMMCRHARRCCIPRSKVPCYLECCSTPDF